MTAAHVIVDAHVHVFTQDMPLVGTPRHKPNYDFTTADLLRTFDEAGVHVVPFQVSHPNFITHKKITAACVCLLIGQTPPVLTGKIVLTP